MPRGVFRIMRYEEARNAAWRAARPKEYGAMPPEERDATYNEFCREFDLGWYPKYPKEDV